MNSVSGTAADLKWRQGHQDRARGGSTWIALRRRLAPIGWLSPALLLIFGVIALPAAEMVRTSLLKVDASGATHGFNGLGNYRLLLSEPALGTVIRNTVLWVVLVVGGSLLIALAVAQLINKEFAGRRLVRWSLIVPWAAALVMTSTVWRYMFEQTSGVLNRLLLDLHLISSPVGWYQDPNVAFWSVCAVGIIVTIPFTTYIILAGLQSIDRQVYEASMIDGATRWQTYRRITLPLLRPALQVATILGTVYVFNSFPVIWVITGDNPGNASDTTITWAYKIAFRSNLNAGEAAALSVLNVLFLLLVVGVYLRVLRPRASHDPRLRAARERLGELLDRARQALARWRPDAAARPVCGLARAKGRASAGWRRVRPVGLPVIGALVGLFFLVPYIVMFLASLKDNANILSTPATYLPTRWTWSNWSAVWHVIPLASLLRNSIIIAVTSTLVVLAVSVPAAYYTARFRFRGRSAFLNLVLVTQMFAPVALVVGIFEEMLLFHAINTYWSIIITYAAFNLAFSIWILHGQFATVDRSIEEAAWIDGLGPFRSMMRIMVPLVRPGLVTAIIFTFIQAWNEFPIALTVFDDPTHGHVTLPVGIQQLVGLTQTQYQYMFVASLIAIIPVVALFIAIERHLMGGLTAGAIK